MLKKTNFVKSSRKYWLEKIAFNNRFNVVQRSTGRKSNNVGSVVRRGARGRVGGRCPVDQRPGRCEGIEEWVKVHQGGNGAASQEKTSRSMRQDRWGGRGLGPLSFGQLRTQIFRILKKNLFITSQNLWFGLVFLKSFEMKGGRKLAVQMNEGSTNKI